jgi:hypothetical protein
MSRRIVIAFLGFAALLGCNHVTNPLVRLIPAEQFPGAECEKLPHESVSAFRTADPNWVVVIVGKRPKAVFHVDIVNDRVYEIPTSGLTNDKVKGWRISQDALSEGALISASVAKYDARFYREGNSLEFSTRITGKVRVDRINSEHLFWDSHPPPDPYDPYYHHEISVKNLRYDPVKGVVSMDIVNKSNQPDFAILEPQIKTGKDQFESCLEKHK